MHMKYLSVTLKEMDHLEDLCVGVRIILKWKSNKQDVRTRNGFIWLRTRTSGGFLRTP